MTSKKYDRHGILAIPYAFRYGGRNNVGPKSEDSTSESFQASQIGKWAQITFGKFFARTVTIRASIERRPARDEILVARDKAEAKSR